MAELICRQQQTAQKQAQDGTSMLSMATDDRRPHRQAFAASAAAELLREAEAAQEAVDDDQAVSNFSICTAPCGS